MLVQMAMCQGRGLRTSSWGGGQRRDLLHHHFPPAIQRIVNVQFQQRKTRGYISKDKRCKIKSCQIEFTASMHYLFIKMEGITTPLKMEPKQHHRPLVADFISHKLRLHHASGRDGQYSITCIWNTYFNYFWVFCNLYLIGPIKKSNVICNKIL